MKKQNIYLIKNLAPWMIDELIAFSKFTNADVILLRKQKEFYKDSIKELKSKDLNIHVAPFSNKGFVKKMVIISRFFIHNFFKFKLNYNSIIGFKAIYWFLRLDISYFSKDANMHAQFATQPALLALLIKKYFDGKPKFSFTFHAHDIYFKNEWFDLLVKNSCKAFSISQYNIDYINRNYKSSDKVVLSRLGVFKREINKNNKVVNPLFTIGLLSWFVEKKGIMYLLESFKKIKGKGVDNLNLILAGDGPMKEEYLKYIKENDLSNSIKYIGAIDSKDKADFYNSIDLFVLPSITIKNDQDGIPVVLMEAIAHSLPIISTDVSGIPEICINNYNGLLIKEKSVDELMDAICYIKNDNDAQILFSNNSLTLSEKYDIEFNSKEKLISMKWV